MRVHQTGITRGRETDQSQYISASDVEHANEENATTIGV